MNINRRIEYTRTYQDTAYLKLVQKILNEGFTVMDRTGTGTIGINGYQCDYDMSRHSRYTDSGVLIVDNFPLLTTKRVYLKGIVYELLWFLRGDTNIKYLVDNDVNIWNDWPLKAYNNQYAIMRTVPPISKTGSQTATLEEFVEAIKTRPDFAKNYGELGPVYGKQWRAWETPEEARLGGAGDHVIDQLALMVDQLKNNKFSRRIIVSAWNPADIDEMAKAGLPPCHMEFQALVRPNSEDETRPYLDLQLYIRSNDIFLGAPFNIASYALLLCLLAKECGYLPGKLIYMIGSAHIYLNHVEQMKEQLSREPLRSPTLHITNRHDNLSILETDANSENAYRYDDFVLTNYVAHKPIKGAVAV